jgi:hypothetical protein
VTVIQTRRVIFVSWLALVLITMLSFSAFESTGLDGDVVTVIVVAASVIKGRIVLVSFMGAAKMPPPWKRFFATWLVVNAGLIVGFHVIGRA